MSANAALALLDTRMDPRTDPATGAPGAAAAQEVASELLGALRVAPDAILDFAAGLLGFPECRRFALVPAGREGLFWLQSLDYSALTFLLADPFPYVAGYDVELGALDRLELQARDAADVAVLCIVTLPRTRHEPPTMNLQGPLAVNLRARAGRQLVLGDTQWGVRAPLPL